MDAAEFLFPSDLEKTPTSIKRILLIGSCLSDMYGAVFGSLMPNVVFDRIMFNNAYDLPSHPPADIASYDLQYVQIPLRSVLTDGIVNALNLQDPAFIDGLVATAKRNLDAMLETALTYNKTSGLLTFVANFIVPQVRIAPSLRSGHSDADLTFLVQELNLHLARSLRQHEAVYYADVDSIAASLGKRYFLDDAIGFYAHNAVVVPSAADEERMPHWTAPERGRIEDIPSLPSFYENRMDQFFRAVYRQIEAGYRIVQQIDQVKVVIFDLDNTLWRGQIAEHYDPSRRWPHSDGWPLGLWEAVHHLRWRGIMTSIASKNDRSVVEERWAQVVQPPFLKLSDFVHPQIGWGPKAESVGRILEAMNVTAKSAVFVDDNPVERESVRAAFPDIRVLGANPFVIRRILLWSAETQVATLTNETVRREAMIRGQIDRDSERTTMSRDDFLQSLQCRVTLLEITAVGQPAFPRALELVNKTNQFNTTGERWSSAAVRSFLTSGGRVITFSVADRFVEYGLVGVLFVDGDTIHQFVMSCRVLGLDVERAVVAELVALLRADDAARPVSARMIHTSANSPCRDVFVRSGFVAAADASLFTLAAGAAPVGAAHVAIEWLPAPATEGEPAGAPEDARRVVPLAERPRRFPTVGEAFNGASFFDGSVMVDHASAGGWVIPPGATGAFTWLRYQYPIVDAAPLAGRTARFSVVLDASYDILDHVRLKADFSPSHSVLGTPGRSSNPSVRQLTPTSLEFAWDYRFSGEESAVVGALQVVPDNAAVGSRVTTVLRGQSFVLGDDAADSRRDTQPKAFAQATMG